MNEIIYGIILGFIQGLTEFLPVSSSGHLEIAKYIMGDHSIGEESLIMTVVLHFGTALATLLVFRKDIGAIISGIVSGQKDDLAFAGKIILSMVPAAIVGLVFEKEIESFFDGKIALVCWMLIITALLLYISEKIKNDGRNVGYFESLVIGIAQAIAILPGISRSGATISTALLLKIDKTKAARFSFLMVIPLIFGKMAKDVISGEFTHEGLPASSLLAGFASSLIFGYLACSWMIKIVKNSKLLYFAIYCLIVGVTGLLYLNFVK